MAKTNDALTQTVSSPLTKISDTEYVEEYWWNKDLPNQKYPNPITTKTAVDAIFLAKLEEITSKIEENKLPNSSYEHYRGFSECRVCHYQYNGAKEYKFVSGGVTYRYPEGLMHYYQQHNVQPSNKFYEAVMKLHV